MEKGEDGWKAQSSREQSLFCGHPIIFRPVAAYTFASGDSAAQEPGGSACCCRTAQWGVLSVKGNMEERAQELALYIIENKATVRTAANRFGISKSTVHMDVGK